MKEYKRNYPLFSLCGLCCGLCPRFYTDGSSKCPGCGGVDFHLKHPACSVITCSKKHDNVEFCFQCSEFPCERYVKEFKIDSFISYKNVLNDLYKAKEKGIDKFVLELKFKIDILVFLLNNFNDGRRKNFYCLAVNLLDLNTLEEIMDVIKSEISIKDIDTKDKVELVVSLFNEAAKKNNIEIILRK